MADISSMGMSVPSRLGVTVHVDAGELTLELTPRPETMQHGLVRASVLSFVVDAVSGIVIDTDPEVWTLTTDMTVRARPVAAPRAIFARNEVVREGRRSITCRVEMTDDAGVPVATGAIGFARVPRKAGDPPKPVITPDMWPMLFAQQGVLDQPLREAAGISVLDAAEGVVEVLVTPVLRNPAGTLQGAMVALLAEAAAEELVAARFGVRAAVVDLDLRYLAQAPVGPVRTTSRLLGDGPDAPVEVLLTDTSTDRLTTLVYARAVVV